MGESKASPICQRVAQIRLEVAGKRGKAGFARELGISPSTYDYYESSRVPPAEILLKIADLGGVDLRWLITGQAGEENHVSADHPVLRRTAELLGRHPNAAEPLAAFVEILAVTMAFPDADRAPAGEVKTIQPPVGTDAPPRPPATGESRAETRRGWIPILGRSAAGVPQFWSAEEETAGLTSLSDRIAQHTSAVDTMRRASLAGEQGRPADGSPPAASAQIITLREPVPWGEHSRDSVSEFVAAESIRSAYPDVFAVRIDGESMAPEIRHGDLVLLSPSQGAAAGKPAVVQLRGAIGVTCKLYHPAGRTVHLVPINDQFPPTTVEAEQIEWACRVLGHVRPLP